MAQTNFTKKVLTILTLIVLCCIVTTTSYAQVTIGSKEEPNQGALLDLKENKEKGVNSTKGLLLPRMNLSNTKSLQPIFDDEELTDKIKKDHIGLTIFNLKENYPLGLCKGVYTWSEMFEWQRLHEPCCLPLKGIEIENTVLDFLQNSTAEFTTKITPKEASLPITYEWYIDNKLIETNENGKLAFQAKLEYNNKDIYVRAYNQCTGLSIASEKKNLEIVQICIPATSVNINGADELLIHGNEVLFTANTTPEDLTSPVTYEWYIGEEIFKGEDNHQIEKIVDYALNGKTLKVKVTSCGQTIESAPKTLRVCKSITNLDVENSLHKEDFDFASEYEITFTPNLTPQDPSGTLTYQWYLDEKVVSTNESFTKTFPRISEGGKATYKLKLEVSNDCGLTSSEKTIYIHDCDDQSDDRRISINGVGSGSGTQRSAWELTIDELAGFLGPELKDMGVTIEWYFKNDNEALKPYRKISTNNSPKITVDIKDPLFGGYGTIYIGFVIKGSAYILDCPLKGSKSNGVFKMTIWGAQFNQPVFSQGGKYEQEWYDFEGWRSR